MKSSSEPKLATTIGRPDVAADWLPSAIINVRNTGLETRN